MKLKNRKILRDYLIGWFLANLLYKLLWNDSSQIENEESSLFVDGLIFIITWIIQGLGYGLLHIFIERYLNRRVPFIKLLLSSLALQFTVGVLLVVLVFYMFLQIGIEGIPNTLVDFMLMPAIPIAFIYAMITNFSIILFIQINMMLGSGNLLRIITGRFYTPKADRRIFMFLDLRSSTTIAEKIGHLKYSRFIQDCFYDLAIVHNYGANIYQYVGDEAVLEWKASVGKESMNCLETFFAFRDQIQERAQYYQSNYGHIPEFKAGLHIGDITIAEVGEMKREIAFHGDTINTAARIQGECNRLESDLLISEDLLKFLEPDSSVRSENKGQIQLRGKQESLSICAIEKLNRN